VNKGGVNIVCPGTNQMTFLKNPNELTMERAGTAGQIGWVTYLIQGGKSESNQTKLLPLDSRSHYLRSLVDQYS